jgi:hypothetical protein
MMLSKPGNRGSVAPGTASSRSWEGCTGDIGAIPVGEDRMVPGTGSVIHSKSMHYVVSVQNRLIRQDNRIAGQIDVGRFACELRDVLLEHVRLRLAGR